MLWQGLPTLPPGRRRGLEPAPNTDLDIEGSINVCVPSDHVGSERLRRIGDARPHVSRRAGRRSWAGSALAAVVVCGYALLTKVFPRQFDANDVYARLRAPYDYWNATGLTAAMGVICCLWLGARRAGHALLSALAYPATGLLLVTLMLAYSRGALVALVLGLALWFCIVPLRLRGAAVLLTGGCRRRGGGRLGLLQACADDRRHRARRTCDRGPAARRAAGRDAHSAHARRAAIGFQTGRRAPSRATAQERRSRPAGDSRRRRDRTRRGARGQPPRAPRQRLPRVPLAHRHQREGREHTRSTDGRRQRAGALLERGAEGVRGPPWLGAGAEGYRTARLRYRTAPIEVRHAHGFVVQTLADLGLVGLALALALLVAWMVAAGPPHASVQPAMDERAHADRTSAARALAAGLAALDDRGSPGALHAERIGMLSMLCVVVVFGIHSLVDWTWYVPGNACVALLCAGWLAGRGPLRRRRERARRGRPARSRGGRGPWRAGRSPMRAPADEDCATAGTCSRSLRGCGASRAWSGNRRSLRRCRARRAGRSGSR